MSEHESNRRTQNYLAQVRGTAIFRAIGLLASFAMVPLMIHLLGVEAYGVWSTLVAVLSWIVFFDLGVGNGLRNKVAEALAKQGGTEAAAFISSGYCVIGLVAAILCLCAIALPYFVPWQSVFNTKSLPEATLRLAVQVSAACIALNLLVGLINAVLGAVQRAALIALGQLSANLVLLILVLLLITLAPSGSASIVIVALAYGISFLSANSVLTVWFYRQRPELVPRPVLRWRYTYPILGKGMQFLAIQIAVLVIFMSQRVMAAQLFGPTAVVELEVVQKLFSAITIAYNLISAPLWSAYTEAFYVKDLVWIRSAIKRQFKVFLAAAAGAGAIAALAEEIVGIWIGPSFHVTAPLVFAVCGFVILSLWNDIFSMFVNGIGATKVQLVTAAVGAASYVPVTMFLVHTCQVGLSAVVIGAAICLALPAVALPAQSVRIIRGLDDGQRIR